MWLETKIDICIYEIIAQFVPFIPIEHQPKVKWWNLLAIDFSAVSIIWHLLNQMCYYLMPKKILITGANGRIGTAFLKHIDSHNFDYHLTDVVPEITSNLIVL